MQYSFLIIIVLMIAMMWWMQRSQKKQQKKRQEQLNQMQPGNEVVTIGGLHGVLSSIDEAKSTVDIDCEGVILTFDRAAVKSIKAQEITTSSTSTAAAEQAVSSDNAGIETK